MGALQGCYGVARVLLVVMDGVGIGALPDADHYGDQGSNSVGNVAKVAGPLRLPNLEALGLGNLTAIAGVPPRTDAEGAYGRLAERSPGKDTTTGHWELAGIVLDKPFPTYPEGFPPEVIEPFQAMIGTRVIGNRPASGTVIIEELGREHMETGYPIVYTSADSVFQIAAHTDIIPLPKLYEMCRAARALLQGEHGVGRVIARPFIGEPGRFRRTEDRKDFSIEPVGRTILDELTAARYTVTAVGKIADIFTGRGIAHHYEAHDNDEAVSALQRAMADLPQPGLVFVNCIDFDSVWGHRNDPAGYARALESFDARLPEVQRNMTPSDVLILTGDHGCDPTTESTDHSREYTPLLVSGEAIRKGVNLRTRSTFADVAATIAEWFGTPNPGPGRSFAEEVTL